MKKLHPGKPTEYTPELAEEICNVIATSSHGIKKLCAEHKNWPAPKTIFEWVIKYKEFGNQYTRAKCLQVEVLVDEVIEIADDSSLDTLVNENGKSICNHEWVNRSRLRIDARKWLPSKLAPKIYGDRIKHEADLCISHEDALKMLDD